MSRYGLAEQASIIVEGAPDRFCGRPRNRNPYCEQLDPWLERKAAA